MQAIDSALLRPGRLEHHIFVPPPPLAARRELLCSKLIKMACSSEVSRAVRACAEGQAETTMGSHGVCARPDEENSMRDCELIQDLARDSEGFSLVAPV